VRKINKGSEPESLVRWKRKNPNKRYQDLDAKVRQEVRTACVSEQFHLCAYCCQRISMKKSVNEHLDPRHLFPNRGLDFNNIVASCDTKGQCDAAHKSQLLPLTPLMDECEMELKFKFSGRVEGVTERAKETIRVLNLGDKSRKNRALIGKRKQLVDGLLWKQGISPEKLESGEVEDDELLRLLIGDLQIPNEDGELEPFAPVLVNLLRSWLS